MEGSLPVVSMFFGKLDFIFFFLAESGVWGAIDESLEKKVGVQYLSLVREADGDGGCGI